MDLQPNHLKEWHLTEWLSQHIELSSFQVDVLPGDASFRRYFRLVQPERSLIAMDASREYKSCIPFIAIANALRKAGVHTPEIFASDLSRGFLLISDLGNRLYLNELNSENATILYTTALDTLIQIQHCREVTDWTLPVFTGEFMQQELKLFTEWFLEKHLSLNLNTETQNNLMLLPHHEVGVLDFQDAFMGPITYDLVSLLRDCYISWPKQEVTQWVNYYWEKLNLTGISFEQFLYWFDF